MRILTICLLCAISSFSYSQTGKPFITNFPPLSYSSNDFGSGPQNWCIETDISGRVIVANTSCLMSFDGSDWISIPKTEDKKFYKLAKDDNGRIYTGGVEEFGFLSSGKNGVLEFSSLKNKLPKDEQDFGRITNVVSYENAIYFRSKSHIIRYRNNELKIWRPEVSFVRLTSTSAGLFVSEKHAWYKIEKDDFTKIASADENDLPILRGIFNYSGDSLIVASKRRGLFYLYNGILTQVDSAIKDLVVFYASELDSETLLLTMEEKGLVVVDKQGSIIDFIDESKGLDANTATFPNVINEEVWLTTYSGISMVEFPSKLSFFDKKNSLRGLPFVVSKLDSELYIGTLETVFKLSDNGVSFEKIDEEIKEVCGIAKLDDRIIIGGSNGLSCWQNDELKYIIEKPADFGCTALIRSNKESSAIHAAFSSMVQSYKVNSEGYSVLTKALNIPHYANSLAVTASGNLWAAYDGISYIDFSSGYDSPKVRTLSKQDGLIEEMGIIEVSNIDGKVVFGTEIGVYTYDYNKNKLVKDYIFGKQFCDGSNMAYNLTEMRNGDVWITTANHTGLLRKQVNSTFIYDSLPIIRAPISDVWDIYEDDDNIVWICGTEAVVRYDPSVDFNYHTPYKAFVRGVVVNDKKTIFAGNYTDKNGNPSIKQPKSYIPTLKYSDNNITFKYGAAYFATDHKLDYSVMLVGKDKKWSSWRKSTEINYTNLPEGRYTFKVRSRNVYGTVSEEAVYTFEILPPWYRTFWAYVGFCLGGALFLLLILKLNSLRLVRDKRKLEGIVSERTEEVRTSRDEIKEQADQLKLAYQRLVELDSFKVSMTSMIVHDLKNPLNSILNAPVDQAEAEQLVKIKRSGREMLTMVLNILDVYKYENSEMLIDKVPVELDELIQKSLGDIKYLAEEKNIEIQVDLPRTTAIEGDMEVLGRILVNLLTNAIKYSPSLSVIQLKGAITDDIIRIEIQDYGTGIEQDYIDAIFDKFKQLSKTDSGGVRSTGLGLTFCRLATEAHGGQIGVESEFGKGSNFWIELPLPQGSDVQEVKDQIGGVVAPRVVLSDEAKKFLIPYAEQLKDIPYYKISDIRNLIHGITPPAELEESVNKWLSQFKEAASLANRELIDKLINEILNGPE